MRIAVVIMGYIVAIYFFVAVSIPRIRFRWGYARDWTLLPRSAKGKTRHRQPKMGTLSCLGFGLAIAAFSTIFLCFANDTAMTITFAFLVAGFIFGIVGQLIDTGGRGAGRWKKY